VGRTASPEEIRNTIVAIVLGVIVSAIVIGFAGRTPPAQAHGSELASQALPEPVPMSPEPTGSFRAPPAFPDLLSKGGGRVTLDREDELKIVSRARKEIDRVTIYDASWRETNGYPMGDIPWNRGACTDVVVRSLRAVGIDLQALVHEDVFFDPSAYGVREADTHIDHRRVTSLMTFFQRNTLSLTTNVALKDEFRPGDIVFFAWVWTRGAPPEHVGIVSDKKNARGLPLVIQNGGPKPTENDTLDHGRLIGHFRALPKPRT
jgi:uncharacterized protein YijF (DUF1287 family)